MSDILVRFIDFFRSYINVILSFIAQVFLKITYNKQWDHLFLFLNMFISVFNTVFHLCIQWNNDLWVHIYVINCIKRQKNNGVLQLLNWHMKSYCTIKSIAELFLFVIIISGNQYNGWGGTGINLNPCYKTV